MVIWYRAIDNCLHNPNSSPEASAFSGLLFSVSTQLGGPWLVWVLLCALSLFLNQWSLSWSHFLAMEGQAKRSWLLGPSISISGIPVIVSLFSSVPKQILKKVFLSRITEALLQKAKSWIGSEGTWGCFAGRTSKSEGRMVIKSGLPK